MSDITLNIVFDRSSRNTSGKKENKKKPFLKPKGMLRTKKKIRTKKRKKTTHVWSNGATNYQPDETSLPSSSGSASSQSSSSSFTASSQAKKPIKESPACKPFKYLAIDCEMVGTGPKGCRSELARCSIVSYNGDVIYDKFIKPTNPVTDFRTRWSGIRPKDLRNAIPFLQAQKEILKIVAGKVVIGHAISNDFKVLKFSRPASQTRDTSQIPLLNLKAGLPETGMVSLKRLTKALFNKDIQSGRSGHSSVEDAKATMELYKLVEIEWEAKLASQSTN